MAANVTLDGLLNELKADPALQRDVKMRGQLIRTLTETYYRVDDIIEIIFLAGESPGYINLQGAASSIWMSVLGHYISRYANLDGLINGLIKYQAIQAINKRAV
jgi:hypothetical protein